MGRGTLSLTFYKFIISLKSLLLSLRLMQFLLSILLQTNIVPFNIKKIVFTPNLPAKIDPSEKISYVPCLMSLRHNLHPISFSDVSLATLQLSLHLALFAPVHPSDWQQPITMVGVPYTKKDNMLPENCQGPLSQCSLLVWLHLISPPLPTTAVTDTMVLIFSVILWPFAFQNSVSTKVPRRITSLLLLAVLQSFLFPRSITPFGSSKLLLCSQSNEHQVSLGGRAWDSGSGEGLSFHLGGGEGASTTTPLLAGVDLDRAKTCLPRDTYLGEQHNYEA